MHLSFIFILASTASAAATLSGQRTSFMAKSGLFERQTRICTPVQPPVTCERSCGPGYVQCISFPNCYNPGLGQSCCSDGTYCPAGFYCTNAGCCPNGTPLAQCGATITLSVIPPPIQTPTVAPVETSSSAVGRTSSITQSTSSAQTSTTSTTQTTTSTSTTATTSTTSSSPTPTTQSIFTPSSSPTSTTQSIATPSSSPTLTAQSISTPSFAPFSTTPITNSTLASSIPTTTSEVFQTAGAGQKHDGSIAGFALGGLCLAIWL